MSRKRKQPLPWDGDSAELYGTLTLAEAHAICAAVDAAGKHGTAEQVAVDPKAFYQSLSSLAERLRAADPRLNS